MTPRRRKFLRTLLWITTACVWAGLFVATHIPATRLPDVPTSDKLNHFLAYFGLSALIYVSTWITNPSRRWTAALVLAIAMVYGAIDELLQPFVNRHADVNDWLFDVLGAASAVTLLSIVRRIIRPHARTDRRDLIAAPAES